MRKHGTNMPDGGPRALRASREPRRLMHQERTRPEQFSRSQCAPKRTYERFLTFVIVGVFTACSTWLKPN